MAETREVAEERFKQALADTGARDPRDYYRERLVALRDRDPIAYQRAVVYFNTVLVPEVAREGSDPIAAWLDYGCFLAELSVDGGPVQIDASGRSQPYRSPAPTDHLVIHLPTSAREPALAVGLPPKLSPAQKATYDLLVLRRTA